MSLILAMLNLYLFIFVLLTAYFGMYAAIRGESPMARVFSVFCALSGIYLLGYMMELNSATLEQMIYWNGVQYVGLSFIPILWVLMAVRFQQQDRALGAPALAILSIIPMLTFLIRMTNGQHQLFYTDMILKTDWVIPILYLIKGPWYVVNSIFVTLCCVVASYYYLKAYRQQGESSRRVSRVFVIGTFFPWFALMFNLVNLGGYGIDYIALITPLTMTLIGSVLTNDDFLRLMPLARANVFETVSEGIIVLDAGYCVADFNPAAAAIFSALDRSAVGLHIREIFADCPAAMETVVHGAPVEIVRREDEGLRYFSVQISPVLNGLHQEIGRVLSLTDSTDKMETIRQLQDNQRRIEHLSFRDQLTGLYNRRYFEEAVAAEEAGGNLPVALVIADVNGLKLVNDAYGHTAGDRLLVAASGILSRAAREGDLLARIGGDEFAILMPGADRVEAEAFMARIEAETKADAYLPLPVSLSFGAGVRNRKKQRLEDVQKQAEERMYKEKLVKSQSAKRRVLEAIVESLHERNAVEREHSKRVGALSAALGAAVGLSAEACDRLRLLGDIHDIGKVGIDNHILSKPTAMSDTEQDEVRRHPEIGYHILSSVNELSDLAPLVLYHHERWDGQGFPLALQGEAIPLEARIIAIADTYESITADRPYRKGVDSAAALNEILNGAGSQFDPRLAQLFAEIIRRENLPEAHGNQSELQP